MPTYKLTYFNITGIGEPLRFLFHYCGIDFEDFRISFDEWPQYKSKMPMEQLPIVEIDGKVYHQSRSIGRYLAKQHKLYGSNDLEALEIDITLDDIEDWRIFMARYFREKDPDLKAKAFGELNEKTSFFLKKFDDRVVKHGGFLAGNKISWADMFFVGLSEPAGIILEKDLLHDYPALKKLYNTVRSQPKIKAYLDKRPKTDM